MAKQLHAIGPVLVPTKVYYFLQGLEIDFKNKSEIEAKVKYYTEYLEEQKLASIHFGGFPDEQIWEHATIRSGLKALEIIKDWE